MNIKNIQYRVFLFVACFIWGANISQGNTNVLLDYVVASVNGGVVLKSDVERRINEVHKKFEKNNRIFEITPELENQILEKLISETIQHQIGKRLGIEIDDGLINETLARLAKTQGMTIRSLKNTIEESGDKFIRYRRAIQRELLISAVQEREVLKKVKITEFEVERFLQTTGGQVVTAPDLLLSQIVVKLPNKPSPAKIKNAELRAYAIKKAILDGSSFEEMAIRYSDAPESRRGGDLGWRNLYELNPKFMQELKNLPKESLSNPIRSPGGFHIVWVRDRRESLKEEVKEFYIRHILFKPNAIRSFSETRKIAQIILEKLLTGADFENLAIQHSEHSLSASKGGSIGWIRENQLSQSFNVDTKNLRQGIVNNLIESQFGLHILEVDDIKKVDISQEKIKQKAFKILKDRKYAENLESWLREIRSTAYVEFPEFKRINN